MKYPYKNQERAKRKLGIDDYILFSYNGDGVNSGIVDELDERNVRIVDVNGEGGEILVEINDITLYYDTKWDDIESDD